MRSYLARVVQSALLAAPLLAPTLPAQAAPANVTVGWVQNTVTVSWAGSRDRSVRFRVLRGADPASLSQNLTETLLPADATSFVDPSAAPGATYAYEVVAVYDGKVELPSTTIQYLVPALPPALTMASRGSLMVRGAAKIANPASLVGWAYIVACGWGGTRMWCTPNVELDWSLVPGAAYYVVWGPGIPASGVQVTPMVMPDGTFAPGRYVATSGIPWGPGTWTVAAFFMPGPVSTDPAQFSKVIVDNKVPWYLH